MTSAARHDGWDRDLCEDLYVVPLDGPIRALTKQTGRYGYPAVSPDGSTVAFLGADDATVDPQNTKVGLMPLSGGGHRWISEGLDRSFSPTGGTRPPVWLDDDTLIASAEDRGETHLYRLAVDGNAEPERLTSGPITVQTFDAAGGRIAMAQSAVEHPGEIVTLDGPVTSVTRSFLGWERFAVPTTDGTGEIDAWIMRPEGFEPRRKYPVLLNVHGGPFTQYGETFFDEAQMQAAAGFVVLMSNPRGGSGRDTAWGQAITGPKHKVIPGAGWGTVDVDDVLAVVDTALARYKFCDPDRVGMLGGSYGGYMATVLATRHSDRFRAICSERAVNNLLSEEWASDIGTAFRTVHGADFMEDPDEYARAFADPRRPQHRRADAHPPLRGRPALPHRASRGAVHVAPAARQGRDVLPLPRRGPRALPLRVAVAPPDARRDHPRLLHREDAASSATQASMSLRAMEMPGGMFGSASRRYQPASRISDGSSSSSPDT